MQIEFKPWYIKQDEDDNIYECAVRFYEGDVQTFTVQPSDIHAEPVEVTQFVRTQKITDVDMDVFKGYTSTDLNGEPVRIYKTADFGNGLKTEAELFDFLKTEIVKDGKRTPIASQVIEDPALDSTPE